MQTRTIASATENNLLAPPLTMGAVTLNVHDLEGTARLYTDIIGLSILEQKDHAMVLGSNGNPVLILQERMDLPAPLPGDAGLYHLALLFTSQDALARAVERVLTRTPHLFSGSADHLVSEAFYLSDPEGNGIELYYDKDPSVWQWENGSVKMASLYISPQDYIKRHAMAPEGETMRIGHVHLKVGDMEEARKFYVDAVGFNITASMSSALFVSVGKYHHHLGMNTWESRGAGKRRETLGLERFELILPSEKSRESLKERLRERGVPLTESGGIVTFPDPWNNTLAVLVRA